MIGEDYYCRSRRCNYYLTCVCVCVRVLPDFPFFEILFLQKSEVKLSSLLSTSLLSLLHFNLAPTQNTPHFDEPIPRKRDGESRQYSTKKSVFVYFSIIFDYLYSIIL